MNQSAKTYVREFGLAMAGYTVLLPVSIWLLGRSGDSPWRFGIALLPVVPLLFALMAFLRFFGNLDEMQQRIQLHALTFATGVTALLTFGYGLLENVGLPKLSYVFILPLLIALWGIGNILANRRYQ